MGIRNFEPWLLPFRSKKPEGGAILLTPPHHPVGGKEKTTTAAAEISGEIAADLATFSKALKGVIEELNNLIAAATKLLTDSDDATPKPGGGEGLSRARTLLDAGVTVYYRIERLLRMDAELTVVFKYIATGGGSSAREGLQDGDLVSFGTLSQQTPLPSRRKTHDNMSDRTTNMLASMGLTKEQMKSFRECCAEILALRDTMITWLEVLSSSLLPAFAVRPSISGETPGRETLQLFIDVISQFCFLHKDWAAHEAQDFEVLSNPNSDEADLEPQRLLKPATEEAPIVRISIFRLAGLISSCPDTLKFFFDICGNGKMSVTFPALSRLRASEAINVWNICELCVSHINRMCVESSTEEERKRLLLDVFTVSDSGKLLLFLALSQSKACLTQVPVAPDSADGDLLHSKFSVICETLSLLTEMALRNSSSESYLNPNNTEARQTQQKMEDFPCHDLAFSLMSYPELTDELVDSFGAIKMNMQKSGPEDSESSAHVMLTQKRAYLSERLFGFLNALLLESATFRSMCVVRGMIEVSIDILIALLSETCSAIKVALDAHRSNNNLTSEQLQVQSCVRVLRQLDMKAGCGGFPTVSTHVGGAPADQCLNVLGVLLKSSDGLKYLRSTKNVADGLCALFSKAVTLNTQVSRIRKKIYDSIPNPEQVTLVRRIASNSNVTPLSFLSSVLFDVISSSVEDGRVSGFAEMVFKDVSTIRLLVSACLFALGHYGSGTEDRSNNASFVDTLSDLCAQLMRVCDPHVLGSITSWQFDQQILSLPDFADMEFSQRLAPLDFYWFLCVIPDSRVALRLHNTLKMMLVFSPDTRTHLLARFAERRLQIQTEEDLVIIRADETDDFFVSLKSYAYSVVGMIEYHLCDVLERVKTKSLCHGEAVAARDISLALGINTLSVLEAFIFGGGTYESEVRSSLAQMKFIRIPKMSDSKEEEPLHTLSLLQAITVMVIRSSEAYCQLIAAEGSSNGNCDMAQKLLPILVRTLFFWHSGARGMSITDQSRSSLDTVSMVPDWLVQQQASQMLPVTEGGLDDAGEQKQRRGANFHSRRNSALGSDPFWENIIFEKEFLLAKPIDTGQEMFESESDEDREFEVEDLDVEISLACLTFKALIKFVSVVHKMMRSNTPTGLVSTTQLSCLFMISIVDRCQQVIEFLNNPRIDWQAMKRAKALFAYEEVSRFVSQFRMCQSQISNPESHVFKLGIKTLKELQRVVKKFKLNETIDIKTASNLGLGAHPTFPNHFVEGSPELQISKECELSVSHLLDSWAVAGGGTGFTRSQSFATSVTTPTLTKACLLSGNGLVLAECCSGRLTKLTNSPSQLSQEWLPNFESALLIRRTRLMAQAISRATGYNQSRDTATSEMMPPPPSHLIVNRCPPYNNSRKRKYDGDMGGSTDDGSGPDCLLTPTEDATSSERLRQPTALSEENNRTNNTKTIHLLLKKFVQIENQTTTILEKLERSKDHAATPALMSRPPSSEMPKHANYQHGDSTHLLAVIGYLLEFLKKRESNLNLDKLKSELAEATRRPDQLLEFIQKYDFTQQLRPEQSRSLPVRSRTRCGLIEMFRTISSRRSLSVSESQRIVHQLPAGKRALGITVNQSVGEAGSGIQENASVKRNAMMSRVSSKEVEILALSSGYVPANVGIVEEDISRIFDGSREELCKGGNKAQSDLHIHANFQDEPMRESRFRSRESNHLHLTPPRHDTIARTPTALIFDKSLSSPIKRLSETHNLFEYLPVNTNARVSSTAAANIVRGFRDGQTSTADDRTINLKKQNFTNSEISSPARCLTTHIEAATTIQADDARAATALRQSIIGDRRQRSSVATNTTVLEIMVVPSAADGIGDRASTSSTMPENDPPPRGTSSSMEPPPSTDDVVRHNLFPEATQVEPTEPSTANAYMISQQILPRDAQIWGPITTDHDARQTNHENFITRKRGVSQILLNPAASVSKTSVGLARKLVSAANDFAGNVQVALGTRHLARQGSETRFGCPSSPKYESFGVDGEEGEVTVDPDHLPSSRIIAHDLQRTKAAKTMDSNFFQELYGDLKKMKFDDQAETLDQPDSLPGNFPNEGSERGALEETVCTEARNALFDIPKENVDQNNSNPWSYNPPLGEGALKRHSTSPPEPEIHHEVNVNSAEMHETSYIAENGGAAAAPRIGYLETGLSNSLRGPQDNLLKTLASPSVQGDFFPGDGLLHSQRGQYEWQPLPRPSPPNHNANDHDSCLEHDQNDPVCFGGSSVSDIMHESHHIRPRVEASKQTGAAWTFFEQLVESNPGQNESRTNDHIVGSSLDVSDIPIAFEQVAEKVPPLEPMMGGATVAAGYSDQLYFQEGPDDVKVQKPLINLEGCAVRDLSAAEFFDSLGNQTLVADDGYENDDGSEVDAEQIVQGWISKFGYNLT